MKTHDSAAASGLAGWALAHPEFGSSVNPITTRGADYAQRITASPPGFENLVAALILDPQVCLKKLGIGSSLYGKSVLYLCLPDFVQQLKRLDFDLSFQLYKKS